MNLPSPQYCIIGVILLTKLKARYFFFKGRCTKSEQKISINAARQKSESVQVVL